MTATATVEKPLPAPEPRAIKPTAFAVSEFAFSVFSIVLPLGWKVEDALKPEFWVHVASKFAKDPISGAPDRAGSIVEVRSVDHSVFARLYVRAVQERGLVVELIGEPTYFGPKEIKSKSYDVRWNVGARGFDILRLSDRAIVATGLKTKEAAADWIAEAMKAT